MCGAFLQALRRPVGKRQQKKPDGNIRPDSIRHIIPVGAGVRSRAEPDRPDDHAATRPPVVGTVAIAVPSAIVAVTIMAMTIAAVAVSAMAIMTAPMLHELNSALGFA